MGRDCRALRVRGDGVGGAGRDVYVWVVDRYLCSWLGPRGLGLESLLHVGSAELRRFVFGCFGGIYCEYRLGLEYPLLACLRSVTLFIVLFCFCWFSSSGSLFRHSFACGGYILGRFVSTWQSTELRPCFGYLDVRRLRVRLPHSLTVVINHSLVLRGGGRFLGSAVHLHTPPSGPDIRSGCLSGPT